MSNYLKEKKWKKALGLAILLDKPFKCYQIIKEILEQNDSNHNIQKGRSDLEKTLLKLRDDQISNFLNLNEKCAVKNIHFNILTN